MDPAALRAHLNAPVRLRFADGEEVSAILLGVDYERNMDITYEVRSILRPAPNKPHRTELGATYIGPLTDLRHWEPYRSGVEQEITSFETIPVHDASLEKLLLDWAAGTCSAFMRGSVDAAGQDITVTWHGVTAVTVPRQLTWGPSVSVLNAARASDGSFELAMQSGDVIRIQAARWSVEIRARAV
jgi:hypothetical protein